MDEMGEREEEGEGVGVEKSWRKEKLAENLVFV